MWPMGLLFPYATCFFATYLPVAILSTVKIDPSDKHSEKFCVNIGPETSYGCILMVRWFNSPTAQCSDTFAQAYVVCKLCLYVA